MTKEKHGLKMTIDSTATWNSNMERCVHADNLIVSRATRGLMPGFQG